MVESWKLCHNYNHEHTTPYYLTDVEFFFNVDKYKGLIYPAKDSIMSSSTFQQVFPNWKEVEQARDPGINSAFWLRVTGDR